MTRGVFSFSRSDPYIQIIGLGKIEDRITLHSLATLPDASRVLLLSGDFVGFAIRDGDDTNGYLSNWKTGSSVALRSSRNPYPNNSGLCYASLTLS